MLDGPGDLEAHMHSAPAGFSGLAAILVHPTPLREAELELAAQRFAGKPADFLVVVDDDGRYLGLLATDQLVHLLSRMIKERQPT
jgi:hypothetical protein